MESRKITIVSSASQSRKEVMSAATTLAELKRDLASAGINYDGMTFMEGYSKTELKSDDSVLPTNVPTRSGNTTNELVFMLTTSQKKIRSGAFTRPECYIFMKNNPLAAATLKSKYGVHYTNASTALLNQVIEDFLPDVEEDKNADIISNVKELVDEIYAKKGLSMGDYHSLVNALEGKDPNYLSDDDIDAMFSFI